MHKRKSWWLLRFFQMLSMKQFFAEEYLAALMEEELLASDAGCDKNTVGRLRLVFPGGGASHVPSSFKCMLMLIFNFSSSFLV